jgi:hypothetical protein
MESTKIASNINLHTLAKTNQGAIPLPCTLVPSARKDGPPHKWDGCPVLHIGNSSGWYLFTLLEHGLLRFEGEPLSIWGDYQCLNIKEILDEAIKAVGWDFSDEVLPPLIETTYYTEIKRETCPRAPAYKWHLVIYEVDGSIYSDRWCKKQTEAAKELELFTTGKATRKFWRGNQRHVENYLPK